jgi:CAAX prenyl protease-like protein
MAMDQSEDASGDLEAVEGHAPRPKPEWLSDEPTPPLPRGIWGRWPGLTYVLPFAVFMIGTFVEPSRPEPSKYANVDASKMNIAEQKQLEVLRAKEQKEQAAKIPYRFYPYIYTGKIVATALAMLFVLPGYLTWRPFRISVLALIVGAVGAVLWILLAKLQVATYSYVPPEWSKWVELGGERAGYNPLKELSETPGWSYAFLAIRFFGLVLIVPIIEEFFLRAFLIRYVMHIDWFMIPFGKVNGLGLATVILFPVLAHPERLAALVWFSLVTWLMLRTRNIWDCVAAHAVTNLLMGLWVVYSDDWWMM